MSDRPKIVLVTGGSSGIGQAICKRLAGQGHTVIGTTRSLEDQPDGYELIRMEVTDDHSVKEGVQGLMAKHGRIDVVVNNAGLGIQGPAEDIEPAQAMQLFNANVFGPHRLCRTVLPGMRAQGKGLIINISSLAANFGLPYRSFYSASKAALERYTETLSMEVAPLGITVVSVQPGEYRTNIGASRLRPSFINEAYRKGYERAMELLGGSLHYSRDPDEVAVLVQRIMASSRPKAMYRAAHGMQLVSVLAKKFLPGRAFERMVMKHYE